MALSKAAKVFTKLYQKQKKDVSAESDFGKEWGKIELSKKKITPKEAEQLLDAADLYGGIDGAFDKIVDLELRSVAAGTKPQKLKSFWIATGAAADPKIEKLTQDELLNMILNKKTKKSKGGLLEMDRQQYKAGTLVKLLRQLPKEASKDLPKGASDDLSPNDARQLLKFVTDNDDNLPPIDMISRLGKDLDVTKFNLSDKQMREAVAMKELLEISKSSKGGKAKYLAELLDDEAFETFGEMFLDDLPTDTRLMKAEGDLVGGQKNLDMNKDGDLDEQDFKMLRTKKQEGGSLLADDLEDMKDVEMEMESDEEMEDNFTNFVMKEALSEEEQETLQEELNNNEELNSLFEKVMDVAQEFSGSGPVEGPGSEVSDSIPARLSDGEFVFTAKAVEEIGADNLMSMMKEAEASADERQPAQDGGMMKEEMSRLFEKSDVNDEIKKSMLSGRPHVRS